MSTGTNNPAASAANNTGPSGQRRPPRQGDASAPPGLNPEQPLLSQPFKGLVDQGLILKLTVEFDPFGAQVYCTPSEFLCSKSRNKLVWVPDNMCRYPAGLVLSVARDAGLTKTSKPSASGNSTKQEAEVLPEKSLCDKDFPGTTDSLTARLEQIATKCGGNVITGRVRSGGLKFTRTVSFSDWWNQAPNEDRLLAFSDGPRRKKIGDLDISAIAGCPSPFRDDVQFVVGEKKQETGDPEPQEGSGSLASQ